MRGEWAIFKSRYSVEDCKNIISDSQSIPIQPGKIGVGGELRQTDYRKSEIKFINRTHNKFEWLFDDIWNLANEANNTWFNFDIERFNFIQLAEYSDAYRGEYKRHHDVFWLNNDPKYHRKMTCVIQLTDPSEYEGGDLELYDLCGQYPSKDDLRAQGTMIFFPSFIPHAAIPVTKGTRHSLAIWFDGPKWK